jgi:hypothetical protein
MFAIVTLGQVSLDKTTRNLTREIWKIKKGINMMGLKQRSLPNLLSKD